MNQWAHRSLVSSQCCITRVYVVFSLCHLSSFVPTGHQRTLPGVVLFPPADPLPGPPSTRLHLRGFLCAFYFKTTIAEKCQIVVVRWYISEEFTLTWSWTWTQDTKTYSRIVWMNLFLHSVFCELLVQPYDICTNQYFYNKNRSNDYLSCERCHCRDEPTEHYFSTLRFPSTLKSFFGRPSSHFSFAAATCSCFYINQHMFDQV